MAIEEYRDAGHRGDGCGASHVRNQCSVSKVIETPVLNPLVADRVVDGLDWGAMA
jgi:hypothetical protein